MCIYIVKLGVRFQIFSGWKVPTVSIWKPKARRFLGSKKAPAVISFPRQTLRKLNLACNGIRQVQLDFCRPYKLAVANLINYIMYPYLVTQLVLSPRFLIQSAMTGPIG